MEKNALVNIVVTTFNRLEYTKQSIPSIRETASKTLSYMITVVDNGSTDGTQEKLKCWLREGIIDNLILLNENIGISKAQNIGWKMFEDVPYYAKIDNDVVFNKKNWLDGIINTLNRGNKIGALGYQCTDDKTQCHPVSENGVSYKVKNGNIGGACFFVPKYIKDEIGFWCEEYGKYGEEDADYGMRLAVSRYKNCYMVDGDVMTHLPDEKSDYRTFKDEERKDNLKGKFWDLIAQYQSGERPLKIETNILEQLEELGEIIK